MPRKKRRLWLNVRVENVKGVSRRKILETLIDGIKDGSYSFPKRWKVTLQWKNKESASLKEGPFRRELKKSRKPSDGFDKAVTTWLERKLAQFPR